MVGELSANTKKVYDAMVKMGKKGDKPRGMEDIVREAKIPKGAVANSLNELMKKKIVKRKAGEKTAKYYLL